MVGEEVSDLVGFGQPEALEDIEGCRGYARLTQTA
jgi:hypothetical protein